VAEPARKPLLAANWKMHKTVAEAQSFLADLLPRVAAVEAAEIAICPAYPALAAVVEHCASSRVRVCAQNMHEAADGAFTGEVSAPMLVELGVDGVILGHSERRQYFGETDAALARKLPAAFAAGLAPILCVGESEAQRDAGETERVLREQLTAGLATLENGRLGELAIAYEPIWAIGTGRTATPEQAQDACAFVRAVVGRRDDAAGNRVRVLYGGSVKPENAGELLDLPDVDGALVGGASLDPEAFASIVAAAA